MAKIYTRLRGNETDGETHLFELFAEKLPAQFHVWHNFVEPKTHKEIDFVVLHPKYGLWVMEVKDWLIHQIRRVDPENCRIWLNGQEVEVRNPIRQARENHYPIRNLLMEEKSLLHQSGKFEGNLLFPVHHIVVFSNISREELESRNIYALFPGHQIITADEIRDPGLDEIVLENLLIEKRSPRFLNHLGLNDDQIAAIDRILNPQVVIAPPPAGDAGQEAPREEDLAVPEPLPSSLPGAEESVENRQREMANFPPEEEAPPPFREAPAEAGEGDTGREIQLAAEATPPEHEREDAHAEPLDEDRQAASGQTGPQRDDTPAAGPMDMPAEALTGLQQMLRQLIDNNNELLQRMWSKS